MSYEVMKIIWYLIVATSVVFYTILDGFDLGVGALHLFTKTDLERRTFLNAIGPIWDGNEVWLIIIAGGLFCGFPIAYATLCSSFYTLIMVLIAGIIFRAVAIEFRSKHESARWRQLWDIFFSLASYVIMFGIGVLLANLVQGIALDEEGLYNGDFWAFLNPYAILLGITSIALFMMHGNIFLLLKTEGELHEKLRRWLPRTLGFFIMFYGLITIATLIYNHHMADRMRDYKFLFFFAFAAMIAIAFIPYFVRKNLDGWAFLFSCLSIALLFSLYGIGSFPVIIRSSINPSEFSITLFNSASSAKSLQVVLLVAAIGVPIVLAYGVWLYKIFHGKVRIDSSSY